MCGLDRPIDTRILIDTREDPLTWLSCILLPSSRAVVCGEGIALRENGRQKESAKPGEEEPLP